MFNKPNAYGKRPSSLHAAVYALELSTGIVKVGFTAGPVKRLATHRKTAEQHNQTVVGTWVSPWHKVDVARENESRLKQWCAEQPGSISHGPEHFSGLDIAAVIARAKGLDFPQPTAGEIEVASASARTSEIFLRAGFEREEEGKVASWVPEIAAFLQSYLVETGMTWEFMTEKRSDCGDRSYLEISMACYFDHVGLNASETFMKEIYRLVGESEFEKVLVVLDRALDQADRAAEQATGHCIASEIAHATVLMEAGVSREEAMRQATEHAIGSLH